MRGTLAAVYGWFVTPIGWSYALVVWGYALAWFIVNNVGKVWIYRAIRGESLWMVRHFARVHRPLHPGHK